MSEVINNATLVSQALDDAAKIRNTVRYGVYPNLLKLERVLADFQTSVSVGGKYESLASNPLLVSVVELVNNISSGEVLTEITEAKLAIEAVEEDTGIFELDLSETVEVE